MRNSAISFSFIPPAVD